jgi:rubrerythrin
MRSMPDAKSVREILEELAAEDDRLRESFPAWLEELDRKKAGPRKPPARAGAGKSDEARTG